MAPPMPGHPGPAGETVQQYGREYGTYRSGQYLLPHDERERDRLDIMHALFITVREPGMRLTNCPTDRLARKPEGWEDPTRVLDLGCGTGIWMFEMAQKFPYAEFRGVDIHRMGPAHIPPNVSYTAPWDYEGPWALGEKSWDLIRLQMGLGSVSNWRALYQKILDHLVPGTGYFESVEIDLEPRSADATLKPGKLTEWWEHYIKRNYEAAGRRMDYDPATPDILTSMGFKDVTHREYMIPLNEWHEGQMEQRAAMWWQVAMGPGTNGAGGHGLEAISLALLCRWNNWPPHHVKLLCNDALAQASDPNVHAYNVLHVVTARAPGPNDR